MFQRLDQLNENELINEVDNRVQIINPGPINNPYGLQSTQRKYPSLNLETPNSFMTAYDPDH